MKKNKLLSFFKHNMAIMVFLLTAFSACKKDETKIEENVDRSRIKFVLQDNFSLSGCNNILQYAGLADQLGSAAEFTLLTPTNTALGPYNISTVFKFYSYTPQEFNEVFQYHILPGKISFKAFPLGTEQVLKTMNGSPVYVKKYLDKGDTVITVNGLKVIAADNPASNGYLQVIPDILNSALSDNLLNKIRGSKNLSLFAAALQRSGLDVSLWASKNEYTILAPSNEAFKLTAASGKGLGISTLDSILIADPARLAGLLKYHFIRGRHFQPDLYKNALTDDGKIRMLNEQNITVGGNSNSFNNINFLGAGNSGSRANIETRDQGLKLNSANVSASDGVIHLINKVLIP